MKSSPHDQNGNVRFAINHMVAPRARLSELLHIAKAIGVNAIEVRNDLQGVPILDGSTAADVKAKVTSAGIEILSINALQRFDEWSEQREAEAKRLINFAAECGAHFVVLCPVDDPTYDISPEDKVRGLRNAVLELKPLLEDSGVVGLIEPLGFKQSSLRSKRAAVEAIVAGNATSSFKLVHDTFHHYVAAEEDLFPEFTGLIEPAWVLLNDQPCRTAPDGTIPAGRLSR